MPETIDRPLISDRWSRRRFLNASLKGGAALGLLPVGMVETEDLARKNVQHASLAPSSQVLNVSTIHQSIDTQLELDVNQADIQEFVGAQLDGRVADVLANPDLETLLAAVGRNVDTTQASGGVISAPPSTAGTETGVISGVFLAFEGELLAAMDGGESPQEFVDGVFSVTDEVRGDTQLFAVQVRLDVAGNIDGGTAYWVEGGVAQSASITLDNYLTFDDQVPILLNGDLGLLEIEPTALAVDLIPKKYKKANGKFVGVKRAACLAIACLAIKKGCGLLAKVLVCSEAAAEAGAACIEGGFAAAACSAVVGGLCVYIIGKICRLIAKQAGITAPAICDKLGIKEPAC